MSVNALLPLHIRITCPLLKERRYLGYHNLKGFLCVSLLVSLESPEGYLTIIYLSEQRTM